MKTNRLLRTLRLLTALQSARRLSVQDLMRLVRVSRRTLFRDLEALRIAGIPIEYDHNSRSYMIEEDFFLPPMAFSEQEAFAVLMTLRRICPNLDLPYQAAILSAALKLENSLPAWLRRQTITALSHIFIRPVPRHRIEGFDRIFACFQEAVVNRRTVNIQYSRTSEGGFVGMELCPVHLVLSDQRWHVLAKNPRNHEIHCLSLDRIQSVEPAGKRFLLDPRFSVVDHLGNAWSISPEGKLHTVRLRFMPEIATEVISVQWHHSQRVKREPVGSAILEFRVDGLNEILWWILSYGDLVEVLAPKVLRDRVCQIAAQTLEANR